ncbi:MAG TPA: UDP-N-acetylmuramoyl-L-alanyl-D-glutamate--2,6-diaminopimelate ligase [Saprospiraceae bacterium]|nr:UDP-N-acetylmuramoyl-L-alanyl-D-glutamate--2,6-diaminopimelate ligase [Saprospiraceae bacterium]
MKNLKELLTGVERVKIFGQLDQMVSGFCQDSRSITGGQIYVAIKGFTVDGHQFIPDVLKKGIKVVLCEDNPDQSLDSSCFIVCENLHETLIQLLNRFYENPADQLCIVGVTGTNGKTTVASLLYQLYMELGYRAALISTVEIRILNSKWESTHTTPDCIKLYELLDNIRENSCEYVFMEVSSHAVDQGRIDGINYKVGIFTNLTQDHMDYHKTMDHYLKSKKKFFDRLTKESIAIYNGDDKNGQVMIQNTRAKRVSYGLKGMYDYKIKILENNLSGLYLKYEHTELYSKLIGEFNAYNLLAVIATAIELGEHRDTVLEGLSTLSSVKGRFEWMSSISTKKIGIVDYAHTPDAVEKIVQNIKAIKQKEQRVITVLGCGGNRDEKKRPIMAKTAVELSDFVIFTSDNPRNEDPQLIIQQMEAGVPLELQSKYLSVVDRKQAIKTACQLAKNQDIILVAGKGHETYQEIKNVKHDFDDYKILKEFIA